MTTIPISPADRAGFAAAAAANAKRVDHIALRLIAAASPNPPNDTRTIARTAAALLAELIPSAEVSLHAGSETVMNLVARVRGARRPDGGSWTNMHLDHYPIGDPAAWRFNPAGELRDGRLYGRGASDMKGGIACSILALAQLAEHRELWAGEAVLTLGSDEEKHGPAR